MIFKVAFSSILIVFFILECTLFINADVSHLPIAAPQTTNTPPVTEVCLGCICEAISGCNRAARCDGPICGLFKITWGYWADAGKPTFEGESPDSESAYSNCVNDPLCAARAVQNYMAKFGQDCNGDGVINCYDHAAIHKLGGYGCSGELSATYSNKLETCLKTVQAYQTG